MKILLYTRPISPPWDEASKNLARDLALKTEGNFEFHILTTKKYAKELQGNLKSLETSKASIIPEPIFSSYKFDWIAKLKLLSRLYFSKLDFDIIHFPFTPRLLTSFLIRLRLKFFKGRTVQTIAAVDDSEINNKTFFADRIIAQSKYTAEKLRKAGIRNVEMIYPGIDLEIFRPEKKDSELMKELGIKLEDFVLLYAGEYTKIRGVDTIVDVFLKLSSKYPKSSSSPYKLILALRIKNDKDLIKHNRLVEKIRKEGYDKNVIFTKEHHEEWFKKMGKYMIHLFNISHVNLFPVAEMTGKFDIPYAIIEAMACGKPTIISDLPILTEHIRDGENGIIVPKENSKKLAESIKNIKNSPVTLDRIGSNARKYVEENFDIKKTAKKYAEIYNNL